MIVWIGSIQEPYRHQPLNYQRKVERVRRVSPTGSVNSGGEVRGGEIRENRIDGPYISPSPQHRRPVLQAAQLMTSRVYTLSPDDPLSAVEHLFRHHKFHHVPIVDSKGKLIGMVSDRDLLLHKPRVEQGEPLTVGDIMSKRVLAAHQKTPIREIAGTMASEFIHGMPIVDESGSLLGLITATDILGCLVNRAGLDLWM